MEPIDAIRLLLEAHQNESNAIPMGNYMKNHFPFLGIKKPEREKLVKQFFKESEILKQPLDFDFIQELWKKDEREYQYTALDYLEKSLKKLKKDNLPFLEKLITTKSWWDTVDIIAPKLIGKLAQDYPEIIEEVINGWAVSENFWLIRAAILFQLKWKDRTNEKLLYHYIEKNASTKEFFIQKAMGWALREYSKTNPDSVKQFIEGHALPKLTIREGRKYLT
ncbi:DNA alkylation repair protein [Cytobacillus sp. Hz8]|uniref:DNA alkylation repair protein n=1 Tax=Cytobacillus sp. Hz8 TaxID=3347168 RepID=UPI0035DFDDBB